MEYDGKNNNYGDKNNTYYKDNSIGEIRIMEIRIIIRIINIMSIKIIMER